jgi:iron(III) transport system ATP-binding protein
MWKAMELAIHTTAALAVQGISKRYGQLVAVDEVTLALATGQFMALLGPSGCGKTTLLRLVAGFEQPDAGIISIGDRTVVSPCGVGLPPEQRSVGMVFQDYALFPHLSVEQNVAYGLGRAADRGARVGELLALVGLEGVGRRMPHQLSGGQQQRVALARALAPRPALLLLDEPFSNLDAGLRQAVRAEVRQILRREGVTALFVTHDQEEALSLADVVAVMLGGRVAQVARPRELYERPISREVAAFVGAAVFLPGVGDGVMAKCALGTLSLARPVIGSCEILLRPEQIALARDPMGLHEVADCSYFGADQVVELRLAGGARARARVPAWQDFAPGDRVAATVQSPVVAF